MLTTGIGRLSKTGNDGVLYPRSAATPARCSRRSRDRQDDGLLPEDRGSTSADARHPTTTRSRPCRSTTRTAWTVLDRAEARRTSNCSRKQARRRRIEVTSRTLDDTLWIVAFHRWTIGPVAYLYDRKAGKVTNLFTQRKELEKAPLAKMHPLVIKARDGLKLVSYLTLPPGADPDGDGRPDKPVPLVLNVHGGPWARDGWGFNPEHQLLANRGYAVLA